MNSVFEITADFVKQGAPTTFFFLYFYLPFMKFVTVKADLFLRMNFCSHPQFKYSSTSHCKQKNTLPSLSLHIYKLYSLFLITMIGSIQTINFHPLPRVADIIFYLKQFIGASVEPTLMIITELMRGGTLQKYLWSIRPETPDLKLSLSLALDLSRVMAYLHSNGIIHRDLKPSTVLFLIFISSIIFLFGPNPCIIIIVPVPTSFWAACLPQSQLLRENKKNLIY